MKRPLWVDAMLSLPGNDFRVWSYLRWRQGRNRDAWPAQETIADDLGLTIQTIRNITRRLEREGWLRIVKPPGRGRGNYLRYAVSAPQKGSNAFDPFDQEGSNTFEPFEEEGSNPFEVSEAERVKSHTDKGSNQFETNTIQGTHTTTTDKRFELPQGGVQRPTTPTVAQVRQYAASQGDYDFDAEYFVQHYEASGWRDKGGRPVTNWKQKVIAWMQRNRDRVPVGCEGLSSRVFTEEEADALIAKMERGS